MDIIRLLPDSVANQIAAGEVIGRPASVVKELVENALDAGATTIKIVIKDAGRTLIQVIDNGKGMSATDARLSFERHATSKIANAADLFAISSMGFRGEALASIAAISHVELRTRRAEDEVGTVIKISASELDSQEAGVSPIGSNFAIKDLFYNVPARRKFLKSNQVEFSAIVKEFERVAISNPQISFTLIHNTTTIYQLMQSSLLQRLVALFGKTMNTQLHPVEVSTTIVKVSGFVCKPESARKRLAQQFFFVNGRYMRHPYFHKAVMVCYENIIAQGEMPNYFLNITVDPSTIDINIHPTKTEIKFENEQHIWAIISAAVKETLGKFSAVPSIDFDTDDAPDIPVFRGDEQPANQLPKVDYNPSYNPFNRDRKLNTSDWDKLYSSFSSDAPVVFPSVESSTTDISLAEQSTESAISIFEQEYLGYSTGTDTEQSKVLAATTECDYNTGCFMQIKGRYIVTSIKSGLVLVDQHRAHIRILYDKYIKQLDSKYPRVQKVLFPQIINLTASEVEIFTSIEEDLHHLGFDISNLGGGSYSINGVPEGVERLNYEELLQEVVESAKESGTLLDKEILLSNVATTLAKGGAIPYGQQLSTQEMAELTEQLFLSPSANFTPDGKPTLSKLSNDELIKRFK